VSVEKKRRWSP